MGPSVKKLRIISKIILSLIPNQGWLRFDHENKGLVWLSKYHFLGIRRKYLELVHVVRTYELIVKNKLDPSTASSVYK